MPEAMVSLLTLDDDRHNRTVPHNLSFGRDQRPNELAYVLDHRGFITMISVEKYLLPVICIFGLVGNTVSTIIFMQRQLRKAPCSFYLAARGICDNGFLFSILLTWMSSTFDLRLSQIKGVCQAIVFMTYLCGCVSVWLCVFITFENFLLIHSPFVSRRICSEKFTKVCTVVLIIVAVGIYNTALWIINGDCSHNEAFSELTQVLVYTDTLLTLVIPTVIIFVLISMILCKVIKIMHIRRLHSNLLEKINVLAVSRSVKPVVPIAKVTKMLLVVSLMFFVLNVPIHGIKLRLLIGTFTKGQNKASFVHATIQSAFQMLYYFSFSVNIIVYMLFGSNFRHVFVRIFCRRCKTTGAKIRHPEAINLVHERRHSINGDVRLMESTKTILTVPLHERRCHSDCL